MSPFGTPQPASPPPLADAFSLAVAFTLQWEGGYVNDPDDPGGETKFGISKRQYPNEDIPALTKTRAEMLYRRDYWDAAGCPGLPPGIALAVFDTAVNCGMGRAIRWGRTTHDPEGYIRLREAYYKSLVARKPPFEKYLKGWLNRTAALRRRIHTLVGG